MTHEEIESLLAEAQAEIGKGNFAEAERMCKEVLGEMEEPSFLSLLHQAGEAGLGMSRVRSGNTDLVLALRSRALRLLSWSFWGRGMAKGALSPAVNALAFAQEAESKEEEAKALSNIGIVYDYLSDYPRALEYFIKALAAYEELMNKAGAANVTGSIGIVYRNLSDFPRALEYYGKALVALEELGQKTDAAIVTGNIGQLYFALSDFPPALEYFGKALDAHEELGNKAIAAQVTGNIGNVYLSLSDYRHALEYYGKALSAHEELGDKAGAAQVTGNIGSVYWHLSDYPRALEYLGKALAAHKELGDKAGAANVTGNIGAAYYKLSDYPRALEYYAKALAVYEELEQKVQAANMTGNIGEVYAKKDFEGYDAEKAEEYLLKAIEVNKEFNAKQSLYELHKSLAELYENTDRKADAFDHFKKFYDLEKQVQSEEAKQSANLMEQRKQAAEREKEIAIANAAANAKHEATVQLLHNVLPPSIADKMLGGTTLIAEKLSNVSVLFADIVNFTKLSQSITPEELVEGLDRIFSVFDALAEKFCLEKIKTIGDAYMVVSGAPEPRPDHAEVIALTAIEMMEATKQFRSISTGEEIQLRIGIHSGEVVAGVIGKKKFAYDLWGDAVNTASRMESHGEAGKIHVSEEFRNALISTKLNELSMQLIPRGEMDIKGKGKMKTYFLEKA